MSTLALDFAHAALGLSGNNGNSRAIHQYVHFGDVLFTNQRKDQLLGAIHLLLFAAGYVGADTFRGSLDGFGGYLQPGECL